MIDSADGLRPKRRRRFRGVQSGASPVAAFKSSIGCGSAAASLHVREKATFHDEYHLWFDQVNRACTAWLRERGLIVEWKGDVEAMRRIMHLEKEGWL